MTAAKKKPAPKQSPPAAEPGSVTPQAAKPVERLPIAVATLDIDDNKRVDLPGHRGFQAGNRQVAASPTIQIEYRPWMRHHVITCGGSTIMVHETWCTWTPA